MAVKKKYYVDTNIYLNIWQREVDNKTELWKLAKDFFEKIEEREDIIYYSGFILKELRYILTEKEFNKKRQLFNLNNCFVREILSEEEYEEARRIEVKLNGVIGFYDIIHILLSKKANAILITRDKKLIEISNNLGVEAKKPEEIL